LEVYTLMSGLSYKVSRNGHAGDWYWEVISGREVIARGLALTSAQARAEAVRGAGTHIERQSDGSALPSDVEGYKGTLKTTTPRSSTTEM
jgi:hypothetical protein